MGQAVHFQSNSARRAYPRHDVGILAALMTDSGVQLGVARLENMSGGGAKLVLSDEIKVLPDHFTIVLGSSSGPQRKCAVVWQSNNTAGVRFLADVETDKVSKPAI